VTRARHVERARALVPQAAARIEWTAQRIADERRERLRALLKTARTCSPWHAERLAGIDVERFEERDLAQLPVMTKDDLMTNYDRILVDDRLSLAGIEAHLAAMADGPAYLPGGYRAATSGGSSGRRGVFAYGWDAWAWGWIASVRYLRRTVDMSPFSIAVVAAGNLTHMSFAMINTFADPADIVPYPVPAHASEADIVARLNALQPDVLSGYASMLGALAGAAKRGDLRIRPRAILSFSEPLLPSIRTACADAFGVSVHNLWIATEAGPIAAGCGESDAMHLSDDLLVVEPVDEHVRPVAPGDVAAKTYVTNLFNTVAPLIRYELADRFTVLDRACPCGSQHRLVGDVQGRLDDAFTYAGGVRVHPYVLWSALGRSPAIAEYQVRQTPRGVGVEIRATGPVDTRPIAREIAAHLERLGVAQPDVTVRFGDGFDRHAVSGKLRRFVPLDA
jgi:phenylacetate-coenzyme A ligase PaaK-like adenylate-forming protein